jgi:hypothetical protein
MRCRRSLLAIGRHVGVSGFQASQQQTAACTPAAGAVSSNSSPPSKNSATSSTAISNKAIAAVAAASIAISTFVAAAPADALATEASTAARDVELQLVRHACDDSSTNYIVLTVASTKAACMGIEPNCMLHVHISCVEGLAEGHVASNSTKHVSWH